MVVVVRCRRRNVLIGLLLAVIADLVILEFPNCFPFEDVFTYVQQGTSLQTKRDGLFPYNSTTTDATITYKKTMSQQQQEQQHPTKQSLCTRSQLRNGRWVPVRYDKLPYYPGDTHCWYREHINLLNQSYWDAYDWQPVKENGDDDDDDDDGKNHYSCLFPSWSSTEFCHLVSGSTIMFVGDSIMREQYMALLYLFGWKGQKHHVFQYGEYQICSNQTRVLYQLDYKLQRLKRFLSENLPQIVIFNRGTHFEPNDDILLKGIKQNIQAITRWSNGPSCSSSSSSSTDTKNNNNNGTTRCLAIWKTSVPGHPQCGSFSNPVNDLTQMEDLVANSSLYSSEESYKKFGWYGLKRQNEKILQLFQTHQKTLRSSPLEIMDAYHIEILRPDQHRWNEGDCLHNCDPGKTDVLNQLLLHIVRARSLNNNNGEGSSYDESRWYNISSS